MIRDIGRLGAGTFDLLVVGGGIYGLTIAYDAAQRGLSVALIEREDFGSGASFNHLRTIHGGLRYLQTLDLARARESVRERRALARLAPYAVRPTPFALPLYRSVLRGRLAMRAGLVLDRVIAAGRNRGLARPLRLPPGRVLSRAEAAARFPGLRRRGLTGAALWYDYVTPESDRLTFAWGLAAARHGAALANHVSARLPRVERRRVVGVEATDVLGGGAIEIAARVTVNATGAGVEALLRPLGLSAGVPLLKAMNLVTRRDAGDEALGGRSASGRHLFLVPWRHRAVFGTWESARACAPDAGHPRHEEVALFIAELNSAFPALDLTVDAVSLVHAGLVPATPDGRGGVRLASRAWIRDHSLDGVEGLVSVVGAKYTTARSVAERVTSLLFRKLGRKVPPCRTASVPLPGGGPHEPAALLEEARRTHDAGLPSETLPHLIAAYGSSYPDILAFAAEQPSWQAPLADSSPVIGGELAWAVRHEMAVTLVDAVVRRTPLGALEYPGDAATTRAAAIVGAELGWSDARRQEEIRQVKAFYERRLPSRRP